MPEFFGDERHERRQQAQRALEDADQVAAGCAAVARCRIEARLDQFEVPVAELAPEEVVDHMRGFVEAIGCERVVHLLRDTIEAREDPAVFQSLRWMKPTPLAASSIGARDARATACGPTIHEEEASGVPDLVGKGAIALGAALGEGDVGTGRSHRGQREAHRIGAVLLDDLDRVDHVALGLRHLLAFGVAHQAVNVDLRKGMSFFVPTSVLIRVCGGRA